MGGGWWWFIVNKVCVNVGKTSRMCTVHPVTTDVKIDF